MDNGLVGLWDLPLDKTYVVLEGRTKEKLLYTAKEYAGEWIKLAKELELPINKYGQCKILESSIKKKINLGLLKSIVNYLEINGYAINFSLIERKIIALAPKRGSSKPEANCIFYPNLPFDFNTEAGATLISALLHDGGINSQLHPHYSNLNIELRRNVKDSFEKVFGTFKFSRSDPEKNQQLYFPKMVGLILVYGLGMIPGRKVINNPGIPAFIFKTSGHIRAAFLRQAFDDEGHVHGKYRNISLKLAVADNRPPRLLDDLKQLLATFGIKSWGPRFAESYKDKKGVECKKWVIEVFHQPNFIKFETHVGFRSSHKKLRLRRIISTLKQDHFSLEEKPRILLEVCQSLQRALGHITSADLAASLNRSQPLAKVEIRRLRAQGKLKLIEERRGNRAAKYVICYDRW